MTVYMVISLPKLPYIHRIYGFGQPYSYCIITNCKVNGPPPHTKCAEVRAAKQTRSKVLIEHSRKERNFQHHKHREC